MEKQSLDRSEASAVERVKPRVDRLAIPQSEWGRLDAERVTIAALWVLCAMCSRASAERIACIRMSVCTLRERR
jgi:hypothetical protein